MCGRCLAMCQVRALKHFHDKKRPFLRRVLDHYGRACSCCGETEPAFLTIDHVNNDGAEHR